MNNNLRIAALLALALGASTAEAAKFYKWTDEQGATHYTAEPPPAGAKASEVRIKTSSVTDAEEPAAATPDAKGAAAKAKNGKDAKAKAAGDKAEKTDKADKGDKGDKAGKYEEKCNKLRADLKTIQDYVRIRTVDEKGEQRVLSDEEKNDRKDDLERQIKAYCE